MKKVLLVSGHLAALKSTLSKRFSIDLHGVVFNKDEIKETLGDTIGFTNREENLKLSFATFKLMSKMMQDVLMIDDLVILESNFRSSEIEELKRIVHDKKYELYTIFLTGNPEVLYERYIKRQPDRHIVHTSVGQMSYATFKESMIPFSQSLYGNKAIIFDTSILEEHHYEALLNKAKQLLDLP